jgi:hypothetical protein
VEAETQNRQPTTHEIALRQIQTNQSPNAGKRPGAGCKPNLAKRLLKGFSRDTVAVAVADIDCGAVIAGLLKSKRERTRLETPIFVRDTVLNDDYQL